MPIVNQRKNVNDLAEFCLVELGVKGNPVSCLVTVVISMNLGGAKRCRGSFKIIILRESGKRASQKVRSIYHEGGGVDSPINYEGCSRNVILLFYNFIVSLVR